MAKKEKGKKGSETELVETLYSRKSGPAAQLPRALKKKYGKGNKKGRGLRRTPDHYKLVCISLYLHDIAKLEEHVHALKARGYTKANKSQVIRFAIDQVAIFKMPRVY